VNIETVEYFMRLENASHDLRRFVLCTWYTNASVHSSDKACMKEGGANADFASARTT
jgi:hypothetical protein